MKQLIKGGSVLLYLLAILVFFVVGIVYANWTEAAKHQGLAGGAIVLGYGVFGSFLGLVASLLVAYFGTGKVVRNLNIILTVLLLLLIGYFTLYRMGKDKPGKGTTEIQSPPVRPLKEVTKVVQEAPPQVISE